jgi:hypothetical protein
MVVKSSRRRDKSWDLRVACALISMDVVEPFLDELGFSGDDGAAARQAAREYLLDWRLRDDAETWLASVREGHGPRVADRIAQLSDDLATPGPNHLPWVEFMVKLEDPEGIQTKPRLGRAKLAWLRHAARVYLAESGHINARVDALGSAKLSRWDAQFLSEDFYPADSEDDAEVHFDPGAWLWAWLDKRHWERFRHELRSKLSAQEVDELVSWGNTVIDARWSLSQAL